MKRLNPSTVTQKLKNGRPKMTLNQTVEAIFNRRVVLWRNVRRYRAVEKFDKPNTYIENTSLTPILSRYTIFIY